MTENARVKPLIKRCPFSSRGILAVILAFFQDFFQGATSIVIQISIVLLIFLLFSDQISGGGEFLREDKPLEGGHHPVEESKHTFGKIKSVLQKKSSRNMFSAKMF